MTRNVSILHSSPPTLFAEDLSFGCQRRQARRRPERPVPNGQRPWPRRRCARRSTETAGSLKRRSTAGASWPQRRRARPPGHPQRPRPHATLRRHRGGDRQALRALRGARRRGGDLRRAAAITLQVVARTRRRLAGHAAHVHGVRFAPPGRARVRRAAAARPPHSTWRASSLAASSCHRCADSLGMASRHGPR